MKCLLSISIGPVQDFIASARRSRDLWFGSWLLSELSKAAAKYIKDGKGELIFPSIESSNDLDPVEYDSNDNQISGTAFNAVNKIVALVEVDPQQFCQDVEAAIKRRLEIIRVEAYKGLNRNLIDDDKAKLQVEDLPEFFWAAYPVKDDLTDYAEGRDEAERLLAARKNTRAFVQPAAWNDYIPKSSLDGFRESVVKESAYNKRNEFELRKQLGVREGERLCGVGLLKRHGNRRGDGSFFSTSHVAAGPLLERLAKVSDKSAAKAAATGYVRHLAESLWSDQPDLLNDLHAVDGAELHGRVLRELQRELGFVPERATKKEHEVFGRWDGHLLFEERLREFFTDHNKLGEAKKALRRFLMQVFKGEEPKPYPAKPYYVLLHADGDRMGEAIDAQRTKDRHTAISSKLSEFAAKVRRIVEEKHDCPFGDEEHKGSLVYAGGDDVLAFLPLHEALFCARELADEFRKAMSGFSYTRDGEKLQPTLSVGLAVGHHLDPLQDTLELARNAEKAAKKQVKDKNALAIIVSKRSGVDWLVKGSWRDRRGDEKALDNRLNYFIYLYLKEAFPRGVGHELRDASLYLQGSDQALRAEALRIIKRKRTREGKLKEVVFKKMEDYLNDPEFSIEELAYQIITARAFADAVRQAGISAAAFAKRAGLQELERSENE
ncbi:MAG: type III-B CRISPR-associated protein Cas10/Cmr2 [Pyrinomonadaceae bacterium]